jgi:hypothetical protein
MPGMMKIHDAARGAMTHSDDPNKQQPGGSCGVVIFTHEAQVADGAVFSVSTVLALLQQILRERRQFSQHAPVGDKRSGHAVTPGRGGRSRLARGLTRRVLWRS